MRTGASELKSPHPLASYLPDVYVGDASAGGADAPTPPFPLGTYVADVGTRHLPDPEGRDPGTEALLGEWILALTSNADVQNELSVALFREGELASRGSLVFSGTSVTVSTTNCGTTPGRYRWRYDGELLTLESVDDACASRRALLTARRWRRMNFAERFISAFDDLLAPIFSTLDNLDSYVDPRLAPRDFVDWLSGWVDLVPNQGWDVRRRRDRIRGAVQLAVTWGTPEGIKEVVSVFAGVDRSQVEIIENGGVAGSTTRGGELPGSPEQELKVIVRTSDPAGLDVERLNRIVARAKPAHLRHLVEVLPE